MNAKAKGYVLGAIAAATYGMNPLFALPLYKAGMNPDSVLFFRYLFAIPVLGIMIKARGRNFKLKPNEIVPLILMGLLVSFSSLALFQSYNYMEAGIASTLLFVYPILVALIMAFVFMASRHHHNIPPGSKLLLIQPVDLPQPSAGAVADHCVAQLLADGNAHPIAAQAVAPGVQDHIAIGKALSVVKALEYVVQFQAAGKLHCYFS